MTTPTIPAASPDPKARITGAVYLAYFLTAILGQSLGHRAAALGNALNLISFGFYIALAMLLYLLFRPVNQPVSLLAAVVSLAGSALGVLDPLSPRPGAHQPAGCSLRY